MAASILAAMRLASARSSLGGLVRSYSWPESCLGPGVPPELAHAIGVINLNWNWCEFILQFMLVEYLDLAPRIGDRIAGMLQNKSKQELLEAVVHELEPNQRKRGHMLHFIRCYDICRENRNFVTHGLCVLEYPDLPGIVLQQAKVGVALHERVLPVTSRSMVRLCEETGRLFEYGAQILDIGRFGENGKLSPWPRKPPLPRRLTSTLPIQRIWHPQPES